MASMAAELSVEEGCIVETGEMEKLFGIDYML